MGLPAGRCIPGGSTLTQFPVTYSQQVRSGLECMVKGRAVGRPSSVSGHVV